MFARCAPKDLEFSARKLYFDGGIKSPMSSADRDSRARAGAASERFAGATLEHAQPDVRSIHDFHESHVHALRKARVTLDGGTEPIHRCAGYRGDGEHRVRVAHRYGADLHFGARDRERVDVRLRRGFKGKRLRIEIGRSHIHRHEVAAVNAGADEAGGAVEHEFAAAVARVPTGAEE